ncbi:hypothetical protein LC55x_0704 [Lysobacter capsici]|nr:hypothetical protein LC55x_0704 [Lysobacter capsici]
MRDRGADAGTGEAPSYAIWALRMRCLRGRPRQRTQDLAIAG